MRPPLWHLFISLPVGKLHGLVDPPRPGRCSRRQLRGGRKRRPGTRWHFGASPTLGGGVLSAGFVHGHLFCSSRGVDPRTFECPIGKDCRIIRAPRADLFPPANSAAIAARSYFSCSSRWTIIPLLGVIPG